jgi:hypothetical protein
MTESWQRGMVEQQGVQPEDDDLEAAARHAAEVLVDLREAEAALTEPQ